MLPARTLTALIAIAAGRHTRALAIVISIALVPLLARAAAADSPPPIPLVITVDDLPIAGGMHESPADRERITRGLLDALAKHDIRAVGLVTWANVKHDSDLDLLEMWLDAGHELGNHSYSHLDYTRTDSTAYIADIEAGRAEVAAFLAKRGRQDGRVRWFRFPFLREGDTIEKLRAMRRYLDESGQRNLHVTIDDQDWSFERPWVEARRRGDTAAMREIAAEYHEGLRLETRCHEDESERLFERVPPQVLLLHANEVGAANWDSLFAWFTASGHRFATPDEALEDSAFANPCEYVSRYGGSLWFRIADCRRRDAARVAVETLLADQAGAWNRGDLDAFCSAYTEDATFVSPSGTSQGRAMILDRYRAKYPDKAAMGTLTLDVVEGRAAGGPEVSMLGDAMPGRIHAYSVAARWTLAYPGDASRETRTGMTLLVLHRGADGWKIVQDASM
ncbi:MAG: polysaccharide deacetylase family protein [bacterium]